MAQPQPVPPVLRQLYQPSISSPSPSSQSSSFDRRGQGIYARAKNSSKNEQKQGKKIENRGKNNENQINQQITIARPVNVNNASAAPPARVSVLPSDSSRPNTGIATNNSPGPSTTSPSPPSSSSSSSSFGPVKLLDRRFKFSSDSLDKILLDQSDFTVVAVLGTQGIGKSQLLNAMANSSGTPGRAYFPLESTESILKCSAETGGLDVLVTPDRCIFLDTQPLLAWANFASFIRDDAPVPSGSSLESLFELQSIQLALLVLCVSHVVLVACEFPLNARLFRLLRTAFMMKETLQTGSYLRAEFHDGNPDLVFVANQCSEESIRGPGGFASFGRVQDLIGKILGKSAFRRNGAVGNEAGQWGDGVNLYMIPYVEGLAADFQQNATATEKSCDDEEIPQSPREKFERNVADLRRQVLSLPKLTPTAKMSEREWLRYVARVWSELQNSAALVEYRRILDKKNSGLQANPSAGQYSRN